MCVQYMKIKSVQNKAPKLAFIPCGKCEECRQSKKNQWTFRLRCELDYCRKNDYHIGFFTLTYDDAHLPYLPRECFTGSFKRVQCFSRSDVRTFIDNIRKRLNERYGVAGLRYMVCSELGDSTNRSHYHGLICFPKYYESVDDTGVVEKKVLDPKEVFELIHSQWKLGFVFPRYFTGGLDSHGYEHKPFLLRGDVAGAAKYAAKYCCKDLNFVKSIEHLDIDKKSILFKRSQPFHLQSRSIGLTWLQNKSSADLLKALKNGVSFAGQSTTLSLPLYIKNKVFFSPDYVFESCPAGDWWYDFQDNKWRYKKGAGTHKRLVRRKANDFFVDNIKSIFSKKVEYYESLFEDFSNSSFWSSRRVDKSLSSDIAKSYTSIMHRYGFDARSLAVGFLCYYGVPADKSFYAPYELVWLSHYRPMRFKALVDTRYHSHIQKIVSFALGALHYSVNLDLRQRAKVARLIDYYKSNV